MNQRFWVLGCLVLGSGSGAGFDGESTAGRQFEAGLRIDASWQDLHVATRPVTAQRFRHLALGLEGASEGAHMGHPDFRVGKRVFASLHQEDQFGMVKLTPDQQATFIEDHPSAFTPEAGAWGRSGYTRVILTAVEEDALGEALTLAWRNTKKTQRKKCR